MKRNSVFLYSIYVFSILSLPLHAQQVTYLPNHNNNPGPIQPNNPKPNYNNQNSNNNMPQQFNQGNNGMMPYNNNGPQQVNSNGMFNGQNNNAQYISNNNMQQYNPNNNMQQYNPNNNMQQYNPNNNSINQPMPFYNNNQNNMYQNNNYQNRGDVNPDSLVIVPANSGVYYVADPDVFPMEMIQRDVQGTNNPNEKGFWIYLSRMKDLDDETMAKIQNGQIPIYNNNTSLDYNNGNHYPNNQYNGQLDYNNNGYYQNNTYFNPYNNSYQQLPLNNNNQQLPSTINAKNLTLLDNNSSNTAVVDDNTPLLITPVEVNGTTVCAIKPAQSRKQNFNNNNNRVKIRDNLPTLNNLTRTQMMN